MKIKTNLQLSLIKGNIIMALVAIAWGTGFPSMKYLLTNIPPITLIAIRFLLAAIALLLLFPKALFRLSKKELIKGIVLGLVLTLAFGLFISGLKYTSASRVGFIVATSIIWVPILEYILFKKPYAAITWLLMLICLIGLFLITGASFHQLNIGDLLTLLGTLALSSQIILVDKFSPMKNPAIVTIQFMVISFVTLLIVLITHQPIFPHHISIPLVLNLAYISSVVTAIAFWAQTRYQSLISPSRATFLFLLEPIVSMLFAFWFLNELISLSEILGAFIILLGLTLSVDNQT